MTQAENSTLEDIFLASLSAKDKFLAVVNEAAQKTGGTMSARPGLGLKGRKRALEKTNTENDGDVTQLLDVLSASIIYQGTQETIKTSVPRVIQTLNQHGWKLVRAKDRYNKPAKGGYKDVLMNFSHEITDGNGKKKYVVVELQLLTAAMNNMKNNGPGHIVYEAMRTIWPLIDNKDEQYRKDGRANAFAVYEALESISEALYAAANQDRFPNASDKDIEVPLRVIENRIARLTSSNATSAMLKVGESAAAASAIIRNMKPSSVSTYGTSFNSPNETPVNDDGLSSSGNRNVTGQTNEVPSGQTNFPNMGSSPGANSSTDNSRVADNGGQVNTSVPGFVTILNDILAGKYDPDTVMIGKLKREALAQAKAAGLEGQYHDLFQQAINHRTALLQQKVNATRGTV